MPAEITLLTVDEVATRLHVTPRTVRNLIQRGHFPGAHKMDPSAQRSTFQIPQSDLDDYIDLQRDNNS